MIELNSTAEFNTISAMCKFHTISFDRYGNGLEQACHYEPNIPVGYSCGECDIFSCPFVSIGKEIPNEQRYL